MTISRAVAGMFFVALLANGCVTHFETDIKRNRHELEVPIGTFIKVLGVRYELPFVLVSDYFIVVSPSGHARVIGMGWELKDQTGKHLFVEEENDNKIYLREFENGWKYRVKGPLAEILIQLVHQIVEEENIRIQGHKKSTDFNR